MLHNENSVYDAATGRYHFRVDRRFANPSAMTVRKVTYTKSSGETTSPPMVYLRSDALHKLVSSKHTVQLTAEDHENSINVIATLEETHAAGRYRQNGRMTFPVHSHLHIRDIDIYFANNNTTLVDAPTPLYTSQEQAVMDLSLIHI